MIPFSIMDKRVDNFEGLTKMICNVVKLELEDSYF